MSPEKILLCWSGGKDSAMALHELRKTGRYEVAALLTTMTECFDRISMHGVRRALLEEQAASVGCELIKIYISKGADNAEYESKMEAVLRDQAERGVSTVAFGDIFLEDLRRYREANLQKLRMTGLFPIWKRDTASLVRDFIDRGFKAVLTCVDTQVLDASFAGRAIDYDLLRDLPAGVDPCGENGEFHSFVYDGPIFRKQVKFSTGERVLRERFCFRDLVPEEAAQSVSIAR